MRFIGLSGVAGAGKDLFFSLLSERLNCERISLADELKKDVRDWCIEKYGIDPVTCSRKDKDTIRPFLVFHGTQKRDASNGRYWIERLQSSIDKLKESSHDGVLNVITDIRYDEYDNDEVGWVKNELGGKLIHIIQYREKPDSEEGALIRHTRPPANDEEARNEPKLIGKADFKIEWKWIENGQISQLAPHVDKFVDWYLTNENNSPTRRLNAC